MSLEGDLGGLFEAWSEPQLQQLQRALNPQYSAELALVLATSPYASQCMARDPAMLLALIESGDLHTSYSVSDWSLRLTEISGGANDEDALALALRQMRRREQCRIIWRDFNRLAELAETTADLSSMADSCIAKSLDWLQKNMAPDYGTPCDENGETSAMVVLGMGKLGAQELNLSSDIDLIFTFPCAGETQGGRRTLSNQDYFIRQGQRLIRLLDVENGEGFVFRVDMRLRPYGQSGALAISFDAMEEYCHTQGRDWERYAMVKARVVAGDAEQGAQLMDALRPFVYRRYIDFSAIESLREMKALIQREVQRAGKQDDVKLGAGGIREIEFIAQAFQLIRGGRERKLQARGLMEVFDTLAEGDYLPADAVGELQRAYVFLRNTEHAIQGLYDQQTQALPAGELDQQRVAGVMGFDSWREFLEALNRHRDAVAGHFEALIEPEEGSADVGGADCEWLGLWQGELEDDEALAMLHQQGFQRPRVVLDRLLVLHESARVRHMQSEGRGRLDAFMPVMLAEIADSAAPDLLFERLLPLVESVLRRTAYLVLLLENQVARQQLAILCGASPWIAEQLARHPVLLDELHNVSTLYQVPDKALLRIELQEQAMRLAWDDLEGHMEVLRYFRLSHVLRIAASEVTERLPLMKVSDYLTLIAEVILEHVLTLAWRNLVARHGRPWREQGQGDDEPDFIIVGYGKLGGIELGHGSDLDLVFVHDGDPEQATDGDKPIAGQVFYTRLGQRIIHILTASTTLGPLYEVDMRLRPSGEAGLLVTSLASYASYQRERAWTWEHQALVRARVVAGSARLSQAYESLRQQILALPRDEEPLRKEVRDMRERMRDHLLPAEAEAGPEPYFQLKHGTGGIVDIEFMVQFAVLAWAHQHPSLARWPDNIRILQSLDEAGLLSEEQCAGLAGAYKSFRACAHRLALQSDKGEVEAQRFASERALVQSLWQQLMEPAAGQLD